MTIPTNKNIRQVTYNGTVIPLEQPNCKIFTFTSATAVANTDVTVVSGDSDVASHYADANACVTIRKITNNDTRGIAYITNSNHQFPISYGMYKNYNLSTNGVLNLYQPLSTQYTSAVHLHANSSGNIVVHCLSMQNNFGGASYIITFSW